MKGFVVSAFVALLGCAPKVEAPVPAPLPAPAPSADASASASDAPISDPEPPPAPPRPSRRGECDVQQALQAFVGGEPAVRCGSIGSREKREVFDALRKCMLDAARKKMSFVADIKIPGIDSVFWEAYAGRMSGGTYEVRNFSYDSCPSGCGVDDPVYQSYRCEPLVDADKACKGRKKADLEEGLYILCEARSEEGGNGPFGDPRRRVNTWLGVWCSGLGLAEGCC